MTTIHQAIAIEATLVVAIAARKRWCPRNALWIVDLRYRRRSGRPVWRAIFGSWTEVEAEITLKRYAESIKRSPRP